jgi:hypothetical protein
MTEPGGICAKGKSGRLSAPISLGCANGRPGIATEDQVILAWLQAEIDSVSFQQYIAGEPPNLAYLSEVLKAARSPNLRDAVQNEIRRRIITTAHGFGLGTPSFQGLANDVQRRKARASSVALSR